MMRRCTACRAVGALPARAARHGLALHGLAAARASSGQRTPSRHLTTRPPSSSSGHAAAATSDPAPVAAATNDAADGNYSPWADERVRA
eukprot:scaffold89271_cov63-Phaeocystis_antarctica.AAC.2